VLTSANATTLAEVGLNLEPEKWVARLALLAANCGLDGVVASPREVSLVRSVVKQPGFLVVTPGVRPEGSALFDQKRVTTPGAAIMAGADFVVVGRPILDAADPAEAARRIVADMQSSALDTAAI
jgi:orotidine-5'-phosphate decarboxylase